MKRTAAAIALSLYLAVAAGCSLLGGGVRPPTPALPATPHVSQATQNIVAGDTGSRASHIKAVAQITDENLAEIDGAVVWMVVAAVLMVAAGVAIAWWGGPKLGTGMVAAGGTTLVMALALRALAPYAVWVALGVLALALVGVLAHFGPRWLAHLRAARAAAAKAARTAAATAVKAAP